MEVFYSILTCIYVKIVRVQGHLLFKRSFLPNVLGTQISIVSIIPLMFTALYFLTTKAFLLSKFALIVTSLVSVNFDEKTIIISDNKMKINNFITFTNNRNVVGGLWIVDFSP